MTTLYKVGTTNAFSTALNGNINAGDTTITLENVTGLQAPGVLVIDRINLVEEETPTLREYISFTGISTLTLTGVTRGLGDSTAQSHLSGAIVEEVMTVDHWNDLRDVIINEHNEDGTHSDITADSVATDSININSTINITGVLDEDNMASNSAVKLATQQSIKAYVDAAVAVSPSLRVKVGTFTVTQGTTGSLAITGTGFQPKLLYVFCRYTSGSGFTLNSYGFTDGTNHMAHCSADAVSGNYLTNATNRILVATTSAGTLRKEASFTSFDSDGFTINVLTSSAGGTDYDSWSYIAIG